jgi:hypothetical protein
MVASIARVFAVILAAFVALLRLWYRAVLYAPEAKRWKAARRLAASAGGEAASVQPNDRPLTRASSARRA